MYVCEGLGGWGGETAPVDACVCVFDVVFDTGAGKAAFCTFCTALTALSLPFDKKENRPFLTDLGAATPPAASDADADEVVDVVDVVVYPI